MIRFGRAIILCALALTGCEVYAPDVGAPGSACQVSLDCQPGLECGGWGCFDPRSTGLACGADPDCDVGLACDAYACEPPGGVVYECRHDGDCPIGLECRAGQCD